MIYKLFKKKLHFILLCTLAAACCLSGCTKHNYKAEADEQVYNIIEQKWTDDIGAKTNYKISDTEPLQNNIKIEKQLQNLNYLTLKQTITLATENSRLYQSQKELLYLKTLDLTLARYQFEKQIFGGSSRDYTKVDGNYRADNSAGYGFNQLLATGARISTRIALAWVQILAGDAHGTFGTLFSANITQPLLRASSPEIVQENLTQAERDALYQIRIFNRFRKTFVVSIVTQYYRVIQNLDAMINAQLNYKTLTDIYNRAEKLAAAARLPQFELDQANQDKLKAWDTYLQAQKLYKQSLDEFKIQLSLSPAAELTLDYNELETLKEITKNKPNFSEDEAIATAIRHRLDIANSSDAINDAQRKVLVAADALRADLNLVANVEINSKDLKSRGPEQLEDIYSVGVQLDLPLDRLPERNMYRTAQITLTQKKREYNQAVDIVTLELRQAYRDFTEAANRHQTQLDILQLAQKRFKNTMLLLQYSRANTRDVLDAQGDLFDAQNIVTQTMVDYTIATLNFYRDTGIMQMQPDGTFQAANITSTNGT
ncbi:MAG: TolC family protein [Planctomycetes bacterium]|nr:TolC family protein [Planctomycetota bacterium]